MMTVLIRILEADFGGGGAKLRWLQRLRFSHRTIGLFGRRNETISSLETPMIVTLDLSRDDGVKGTSDKPRVWLLKRNCALSPRQVLQFYLTLLSVSFLISTGFAVFGAWMVLPFAGLEMAAVGIALLIYARHATDHERVVLDARGLVVEAVTAGRRSITSMNPHWVRVAVERGATAATTAGDAVFLMERSRRVAIGRYINDDERRVFASELKHALAAPRGSGTGNEQEK